MRKKVQKTEKTNEIGAALFLVDAIPASFFPKSGALGSHSLSYGTKSDLSPPPDC